MSLGRRLEETGCILEVLKVLQRYYPEYECDVFRGGVHNDVVIRKGTSKYCFSLSHFYDESNATLALYAYEGDSRQEVYRESIDTFFIHTKLKEAIEETLSGQN